MFSEKANEVLIPLQKNKPDWFIIYDDGFNYLTKMCLTNMREAAFEMIKRADLDYKRYDNGVVELGYFECFDLVRAIAYFNSGKKDEALRILNRIESSKFIFIYHAYFLIQQKTLELNMCKSQATKKYQKLNAEIDSLVNKTGFTVFLK
jgi:hypothetical protein